MRTLMKLFSVLVGIVLLAGAVVILWFAHGPQATEAVTTGGIAYTQQEIAGGTELLSMVDVEGFNAQPLDVALSDAAASDLASVEPAEIAPAPDLGGAAAMADAPPPPPSQPQAMAPMVVDPNTIPLTTNVVIDENMAVQVAPVVTDSGVIASGQGGLAAPGTGYEQRVVEIEWPAEFRVGRGGVIRIKLKMLDSGALQPVAEVADNEILATPILITDRYATHNAFVTSNLSAPDFSVQATSPFRQPLAKGGEAEWRYTLRSDSSQRSVISIGMVISWDARPDNPDQTPGPQDVPIWGQTLSVDVNYVFGLITVPQASIAGTVLGVIGFIAEAPLLGAVLEHFLGRLFSRGDKRKEEKKRRSRRR